MPLNCSVQGFWFRVQSVHTTLPNAGPARQVVCVCVCSKARPPLSHQRHSRLLAHSHAGSVRPAAGNGPHASLNARGVAEPAEPAATGPPHGVQPRFRSRNMHRSTSDEMRPVPCLRHLVVWPLPGCATPLHVAVAAAVMRLAGPSRSRCPAARHGACHGACQRGAPPRARRWARPPRRCG